jgi:prepilin-type N-terminal cleavage/methylation domain-containing protein
MEIGGKISRRDAGFTLIELLISIAILSIIMLGLQQVLTTSISAYSDTRQKQDLLADARMAMERIVMYVQATDEIAAPLDAAGVEVLTVSERLLDLYDNASHAYAIDGDNKLDADNDADGLVNEDETTPDPPDYITYSLDKSDADNWKLMEQIPDYSTATLSDFKADAVVCEHVTEFTCKRFSSTLVGIKLTLNQGTETVSLTTRAKAHLIE